MQCHAANEHAIVIRIHPIPFLNDVSGDRYRYTRISKATFVGAQGAQRQSLDT